MLRVAKIVAGLAVLTCGTYAESPIKNVVVLMLENRSFDHMCGLLKRSNDEIDGCVPEDPRCVNPLDPADPSSKMFAVNDLAVDVQPDPHHSIKGTTEQIFGGNDTSQTPPPMNGFVKSYSTDSRDGSQIMQCFPQEHVPVIQTLAQEFVLIDQWHASVPGPTQVNRLYANSATSHGAGTNDAKKMFLGFPQKTIFQTLDEADQDWHVYFQDVPATLEHFYPRLHPFRFHFMNTFLEHAKNGELPAYSWLEPRYYDMFGVAAQDQHPDHDVSEGEALIKMVYEAVRASPQWNTTALLVTYDEHGGFYDHVPPPVCPSPDGLNATDDPFDFKRLGVRVPAIVASPWIDRNTVEHGPLPDNGGAYEHSSIPATLRALFAPDADFLNARDAWAGTFHHLFETRDSPRMDCLETLPTPVPHRAFGLLPELDGKMPLSDLQKEFVELAAALTGEEVVMEGMSEEEGARFCMEQVNKHLGREVASAEAVLPKRY